MILRNTLLDWSAKSIDLISMLYDCLKKQILAFDYIHVDETGLQVLTGKQGSGKSNKHIHSGYLWCYNSSRDKLVFFDYQASRGEQNTHGILKKYKGIIQTDGWQVYENVAEKNKYIYPDMLPCPCERIFTEAMANDAGRAGYVLEKMQLLYAVERRIREQSLNPDAIVELRHTASVPVLGQLKEWILVQTGQVLPRSPIGQAITYCLVRWDKLCMFIPVMMTHCSCDGDPPRERTVNERAFRWLKVH